MVKENEYAEWYEETYKDVFEGKKEDSEEKNNIIKIAGRPIEVYIMTIVKKLQINDQIEIHCLDTYLDRALRIVEMFGALGIRPESGKIVFEKRKEDIISRRTGKKFRQLVNKIKLTKVPEIYRFTKN